MESFCLTTLTCNDRKTLFDTIESFLENTDINHLPIINQKLPWLIFIQGSINEYFDRLRQFTDKQMEQFAIDFQYIRSEENIGLSKGSNKLALAAKKYDYVLHIEDDWQCLPKDITCVGIDWLEVCISFMLEHPEVSTLFLRKYVSDDEKKRYAWNCHVAYRCHKYAKDNFNYAKKMEGSEVFNHRNIKFQHIPTFLFTFNPCIRRNKDYYTAEVFPFDEYEDVNKRRENWGLTEYKDVKDWGWCEAYAMEKTRDFKTFNVASGIFGHYEDWEAAGKIQSV